MFFHVFLYVLSNFYGILSFDDFFNLKIMDENLEKGQESPPRPEITQKESTRILVIDQKILEAANTPQTNYDGRFIKIEKEVQFLSESYLNVSLTDLEPPSFHDPVSAPDNEDENCILRLISFSWRKLKRIFRVSHRSLIQGTFYRGKFDVLQERGRHEALAPYTIHPLSELRFAWEIFIFISLMFNLFLVPFHLAFTPEYIESKERFITSVIFTIFHALDILINLMTGHFDSNTDIAILEFRHYKWKYILPWLFLDIITTFPFWSLPLNLYLIRWLDIFSILLIFKAVKYSHRFYRALGIPEYQMKLFYLLMAIIIIFHWFACLHYFIVDIEDEKTKKDVGTWIKNYDLWKATGTRKYFCSLLRSITLGLAYGMPILQLETIITIANLIIGIVLLSVYFCFFVNIFRTTDSPEVNFNQKMLEVKEYLKYKHAPEQLQKTIIHYFLRRNRQKLFDEDEILRLLPTTLRRAVQVSSCKNLVRHFPIFQEIRNEVLMKIVSCLEFEIFLKNQEIIKVNTHGSCMYFIEHGTVAVVEPKGRILARLHDGDFFGEVALVTNEPRSASVVTLTDCNLYKLSRKNLILAINRHPEVFDWIAKVVEQRLLNSSVLEKSL